MLNGGFMKAFVKFRSLFLCTLSLLSIHLAFADNAADSLFNKACEVGSTVLNKARATGGLVLDTIKSDLTIGEQPSTAAESSAFKKVLKACRVATYCTVAKVCIALPITKFFPPGVGVGAKQFNFSPGDSTDMYSMYDFMPAWLMLYSVTGAPILEELIFTYGGSKIMGSYAQIIVPAIFAACHIKAHHNRNMKILLTAATASANFIHQRVARRDPGAELPVVIMSHMLQNTLAAGVAVGLSLSKR